MPTTISGRFVAMVEGNGRVFTPLLPGPVYVHDAVESPAFSPYAAQQTLIFGKEVACILYELRAACSFLNAGGIDGRNTA
jgi:hypothetical protein